MHRPESWGYLYSVLHISEIESRIAAQATREQRESVADFLIENDASADELLRKVENIWEELADRDVKK